MANAKEECRRWRVHWIKRWDVQCPLSPPQMLAIRQALAAHHPVACGLRWPKQLHGYQLLDVPPPQKVFDGHSIMFTGYTDDAERPGGGVFLFRNSFGPKWGKDGYGVMSFAYAQRYANDALWLERESPRAEVPVVRYEAERMPRAGQPALFDQPAGHEALGRPDVDPWPPALLRRPARRLRRTGLCRAESRPLPAAGIGDGGPRLRRCPRGARRQAVGRTFDLYSGRVCPAGSVELGTFDMPAGRQRLRVTAVGKNSASKGFAFGLDAVDLLSPRISP